MRDTSKAGGLTAHALESQALSSARALASANASDLLGQKDEGDARTRFDPSVPISAANDMYIAVAAHRS